MFYDKNYVNPSYQNYNYNYEYQQRSQYQVNYPVAESCLYQEDINKCLSYVNSDYNSYDASVNYNSSYLDIPQDSNRNCSIKDSGISTDLDENSTNVDEKKLHMHQSKFDEDECQLCRDTTTYLLSTPFINYLDYKFSPPNSKKVSLSSDETNYVEYKLLNNFQFATPKKVMQKDSFNGYLIHPSMFIENNMYNNMRTDFEYNGRTIDNSERKMLRENEMQRLYPMTQHYDYKNELYSFQPNANSTPAKYLYNQQQQQQYCHINNQLVQNSAVSWKKPVVLDPRLSARYDAVFPSLEISSNNCSYDKQSTSINAMDNNVSSIFNKRMY